MRILVVDDEIQITRVLRAALQSNGYEVSVARDGVEALTLFLEAQPDLVITDLSMPEMDGGECVARLIERDPTLLILVISALADKLTAIDAIEKGASGFLCKPFTDRQLNSALRTRSE